MERISRFESLTKKQHFMERVFTANERRLISESTEPCKRAASCFAAKEAVSKAFGRGLYGMLPGEIELSRNEVGAPFIRLYGNALDRYGSYSISVSLTYKDDYTVVSCIAFR
ncbi:MAG: holo-ACP synthase [Clostridia bacterium]|nr:holo-ACP synthase [Clostridia bacterium]